MEAMDKLQKLEHLVLKGIAEVEWVGANTNDFPLEKQRMAIIEAMAGVYRHVMNVPDEYWDMK